MFDYARQRAEALLSLPHAAILVTNGPAGVQASECPCEAAGLDLYLLVPRTSDHLFNLEHDPTVTLLASGWELRGTGEILPSAAAWPDLALLLETAGRSGWFALVRVCPRQIQIRRSGAQWGNLETIDLQPL